MKNLTKIFMAVAVALFAFSCVQDATEDLGVKVGGQTELTLSIEESRTQLGEKAGSLYPVTWCEGDVVAVNGVASTGIEIVGNGTSATFTFPEAIARPWSVVYPATTATPVTEGLQAVTFLATQEYKVGTFCDGAAPMYGVAAAAAEGEAAPAIQLNHLTGVLRFAVKGAGEKLTAMTVTTESGKIAGNFDVDCATGALTAHEDATNVVTVTFGEGLILGEVATPIYVAVPAGEYGAVTVVLATDDAKKMTAKFGSNGEKQIKAGVVREFTEFVFAENDADNLWFEIYTVADMLAFAKTATNFPYTGAKVMASIDMTGVEWTPIEGFGKVFDGGKDMGCEIKGLNAPLFNAVAGTIKNLKLSVDIEVATISGPYAPLVCAFSGTMSDCEVLGKISVTGLNNNSHYPVSGVIGRTIEDATIDNVVNRCNVTVVHNNTGSNSGIGSILGQAQVATNKCVIKNSTNYGAVSISGKSRALYHGGIVGRCDSAIEIIKTTNNGSLTIDISSARDFHIGGFVGSTGNAVTITDCTNNAAITASGNGYNDAHIGGFIGYASGAACNITDSTNTGAMNVSTHHKASLAVGGVFGYASTALSTPSNLSGCINRGNITVSGMAGDATTAGTEGADGTTPTTDACLFVAGVAARINHSINISNCDNYGTLTINPVDETNLAIENADYIKFSGVATFNDDEWNESRNTVPNDLVNYGTLNFNGSTVSYVYMGGVSAQLATISIGANNFTNYGALNIAGTIGTGLYVGGVAGVVAKTSVENFHNRATGENAMNITSTVVSKAHCGGVIGQANGSSSLKTLSNSSALNYSVYYSTGISGKANQYEQSPAVGGVIGVAIGASSNLGTAENLTNTGIVTIKDTKKSKVGYHHFGGVAGFVRYYHLTNLDNNATKFEMATTAQFTKLDAKNETNNQGLYIGGSIGYASSCGDIKDCDNSAELQLRADNKSHIQLIGGVGGILWVGSKTISNCHNKATGKINFLDEYKVARSYVGGLIGEHYSGYVSNCINNADIEFLNGNSSATQFYWGGLSGYVYSSSTPGKFTKCTNNGNITIGPNMTDKDSRATKIGGLVGFFSRGNASTTSMLVGCEDCTNNGRIQIDGGFGVTNDSMKVGGIIGDCSASTANAIGYFANNCTQNANVVVLSEIYTKVAMIIGTARNATHGDIAKDCKIVMGKGVARSQKTVTTDPVYGDDGETILKPGGTEIIDEVEPIDNSNFFNYIYGGTTTWEGTTYDGCSAILLLPEVPANE